MRRDCVIATLRAHEPELKASGIVSLSVFGSVARGDGSRLSLLDVISMENRLSDMLGRKVDLIEAGTPRPRVRQSVDREIVRAF
jgi:predicted nucleotidyltransferase